MFNPDGTHRADADIATDVTRAIQELIKQGIVKPQDAPAKPITGFDDANKYLDAYPTGASESPKQVPPATVATNWSAASRSGTVRAMPCRPPLALRNAARTCKVHYRIIQWSGKNG